MMPQKDRIEAAIRHIQTASDIDPWAMELAVDALKAQGTCEDTVSRQTLQKELALYPIDDITSEDEAGYNRAINDIQKMVLHLPSAQPEPHYDEWCTDCKEYDHERHCCPRWNRVIRETLKDVQPNTDHIYAELSKVYNVKGLPDEAIGIIGDLMLSLDGPSAQPERTCVNCGRTVNNGGWYADGRTRCPIEEHYALPKDGFCHLWEKRNVTDDDYPERREE